jgi:putative transcriptional regulator
VNKRVQSIDAERIISNMIKIELEKLLEGRSLYWLSRETGIRWATLAAMVNGKAQRLDLDALERICEALECQPGNLLVKVERKTRKKGK